MHPVVFLAVLLVECVGQQCEGFGGECGEPGAAARWLDMLEDAKPRIVRVTVFVVADDVGRFPVLGESAVTTQINVINRFLKCTGLSFVGKYATIDSSFLLNRFVFPRCRPAWVGDGQCHPDCNASITNFDGGDCVAIPRDGCELDTGDCRELCNVRQFNWSYGKCCEADQALAHCRDPASGLRVWLEPDTVKKVAHAPTTSWNIYVAPFAQCPWCVASSIWPWHYDPSNYSTQGAMFNSVDVPKYDGLTGVHELAHTLGLLDTYAGYHLGEDMCSDPCFEGIQYAETEEGSEMIGDMISDTRPMVPSSTCGNPKGVDCAGKPWTNTPFRNIMASGYLNGGSSCTTVASAFTPLQCGRMRCYYEEVYNEAWSEEDAPATDPNHEPFGPLGIVGATVGLAMVAGVIVGVIHANKSERPVARETVDAGSPDNSYQAF